MEPPEPHRKLLLLYVERCDPHRALLYNNTASFIPVTGVCSPDNNKLPRTILNSEDDIVSGYLPALHLFDLAVDFGTFAENEHAAFRQYPLSLADKVLYAEERSGHGSIHQNSL